MSLTDLMSSHDGFDRRDVLWAALAVVLVSDSAASAERTA